MSFSQGDEQTEKTEINYVHLQTPSNMGTKYHYVQRIGFPRGSIGTSALPVVQPPESEHDSLKPINLYHFRQETDNRNLKPPKGSDITAFYLWFLLEKRAAYNEFVRAKDPKDKSISAFLPKPPEARLQFITFYCMFRKNPMVTVNDGKMQLTTDPFPDVYRFCPDMCADREGPDLDTEEREALNRFTKPCNYPENVMPHTSRKCAETATGPFHVHRESFKCACQDNAQWNEQLKICLRQNTKNQIHSGIVELVDSKLHHPVDCSREGTQYIGGVSCGADNGGDEIIRSTHHALRCVCKPNYYGEKCEKLKDPCTMSIGNALPGRVACGVAKGNRCVAFPEEGRYICMCTKQYRKITSLTNLPSGRLLDNCLHQIDPCVLEACMHGICVLSDKGSTLELEGKQTDEPFTWIGRSPSIVARCVCDAGWSGKQCSYPVVLNGWSPWSPWTSCEPSCQDSLLEMPPRAVKELVEAGQSSPRWGIRQRTRHRDCMGFSSDCRRELTELAFVWGSKLEGGQTWRQYERRACRPRPCDRLLYVAIAKRAVKRSKIIKQVGETLKQTYTVHLWTVLAFTFVFAIFGFVASFATKMYSEKVFERELSRDSSYTHRR